MAAAPFARLLSGLSAAEALEVCDSYTHPWPHRLNARGRCLLNYLYARQRREREPTCNRR